METCPECGGKLRVIACIEDLPLIAKFLAHARRRQALINSAPRAPPDSLPLPNLTLHAWAQAQGPLRPLAAFSAFQTLFPARLSANRAFKFPSTRLLHGFLAQH